MSVLVKIEEYGTSVFLLRALQVRLGSCVAGIAVMKLTDNAVGFNRMNQNKKGEGDKEILTSMGDP
jgi:hypothetical protein